MIDLSPSPKSISISDGIVDYSDAKLLVINGIAGLDILMRLAA